jgi:hypothetical protein
VICGALWVEFNGFNNSLQVELIEIACSTASHREDLVARRDGFGIGD